MSVFLMNPLRKAQLDGQHPVVGSFKMISPPIMYDGMRLPVSLLFICCRLTLNAFETRFLPPTLGEHNEEVFTELGCSSQDIQDMKNEGII